MKTFTPSHLVAAVLMVLSLVPAIGAERGDFDSTIPAEYRRSFATSRNHVVMVFQSTHWRSLTTKAAKGTMEQQQTFCELLTRSDRTSGRIPYGFHYDTIGDGRIYLLRNTDYIETTRTVSMR